MSDAAPTSLMLPEHVLFRLRAATEALDLSVNASVLAAARCLAKELSEGWTPSGSAPSGPCFLALRINAEEKAAWTKAASAADLNLSEFCRIAALAALKKIEGRQYVRWPLQFGRRDFVTAVK